jgi:hypothetical protein
MACFISLLGLSLFGHNFFEEMSFRLPAHSLAIMNVDDFLGIRVEIHGDWTQPITCPGTTTR